MLTNFEFREKFSQLRPVSYLEVNLSYLEQNIREVKKKSSQSTLIAMIKANAYGHGMEKVSQFMAAHCHVHSFGCASLAEALRVYPSLKKINKDVQIFVFSNTQLDSIESRKIYQETTIVPVVHEVSDLDIVLSDHHLKKIPLVLKYNSGMNRLGLSFEQIQSRFKKLKTRGIKHLMTHLARSHQVIKPQDKTHQQRENFHQLKLSLRQEGIDVEQTSLSNSGAIDQEFGLEETHIRAGLILYGPHNCQRKSHLVTKNISRWVTKIMTLFKVKKGTPIGYGVNVVSEDSLIAVIPLGYGDGLLTYYSGANLLVNGVKGRIVGRISMDMTFIQFNLQDANKIKKNDEVEIWSHDPSTVQDLADQVKTIPYQLMCAVSERVPRVYINLS